MNLTANMGKRVKTGGIKALVYNCGPHGKLTVRQIAGRVGVGKETIYRRIRAGWTGEDLLLAKHEHGRQRIGAPCRSDVLCTAMQLARAFPSGIPTAKEIMAARPMEKSTALRWRRAMAAEAKRIAA